MIRIFDQYKAVLTFGTFANHIDQCQINKKMTKFFLTLVFLAGLTALEVSLKRSVR